MRQPGAVLTFYGVAVLTFMMLMYALESRSSKFILAFAIGCALSASYGFLSGTWPFGVVEAIWCLVALDRFRRRLTRPAVPAAAPRPAAGQPTAAADRGTPPAQPPSER